MKKHDYICRLRYDLKGRKFSNGVNGILTWKLVPIYGDLALMAYMEIGCAERIEKMPWYNGERVPMVECRAILNPNNLKAEKIKFRRFYE